MARASKTANHRRTVHSIRTRASIWRGQYRYTRALHGWLFFGTLALSLHGRRRSLFTHRILVLGSKRFLISCFFTLFVVNQSSYETASKAKILVNFKTLRVTIFFLFIPMPRVYYYIVIFVLTSFFICAFIELTILLTVFKIVCNIVHWHSAKYLMR